MARKSNRSDDGADAAARFLLGLPPQARLAVAALVVVTLLVVAAVAALAPKARPTPPTDPDPTPATTPADPAKPPPTARPTPPPVVRAGTRYLFCFWNVENLFDDKHDKRRDADAEYDGPYADDAHFRNLKLSRLTDTLLKMNGGRGPDIIACCEVETPRAAEMLATALNAKLTDNSLRYTRVEMKDLDAGRHIAPCVITRLSTESARTRLIGYKTRILEVRVVANGRPLTVLATHWTSQITDKKGDDKNTGRAKYGHTIAEEVARLTASDPAADVLVCGDFNDTPDSPAVTEFLKATGDRDRVTPGSGLLFDLMAGKSPAEYGSLYYGKPLIYDHICVTPGLLDAAGWWCDPDTVRTVSQGLTRPGATRREPWRFANPKPAIADDQRGFSDHFPVTVELGVAP